MSLACCRDSCPSLLPSQLVAAVTLVKCLHMRRVLLVVCYSEKGHGLWEKENAADILSDQCAESSALNDVVEYAGISCEFQSSTAALKRLKCDCELVCSHFLVTT